MMRNSLSPTDVNVALIVDGNSSVGMNYRTAPATRAIGQSRPLSVKPNATVNWLKLVRAGTTVTGYFSSDGKTWTQYQAVTLPLNQSIYVGLTAASGQDGWYIQNATFSNVTLN